MKAIMEDVRINSDDRGTEVVMRRNVTVAVPA